MIIAGLIFSLSVVFNLYFYHQWQSGLSQVEQAQKDANSELHLSTIEGLMAENEELRRQLLQREQNTEETVKGTAEKFLSAYLDYSSAEYMPIDRVNAAVPYITDEVYQQLKPGVDPTLPDDYVPDTRFSYSSRCTVERSYYTPLEDGGANVLALCTLDVATTYGSSTTTQMICLDLHFYDGQWKVSQIVFMETLNKSLFT